MVGGGVLRWCGERPPGGRAIQRCLGAWTRTPRCGMLRTVPPLELPLPDDLPWEDQADLEEVHNTPSMMIGDIEVPVRIPGDPRYDLLDAIRRRDLRVAQGMVTAEELHAGLRHGSETVRGEAVIRLRARHPEDRRTIPALIEMLKHDPSSDVRFLTAMQLGHFADDQRVQNALAAASKSDPAADVRDEADWVLSQLEHEDGNLG